jgi:plasmid stabilization system protein ParE
VVKSVGYKIVWDRQALDNLKEILVYLEKQSKQAPKIIKSNILENLEHIKTNPLTFEVDKLKEKPNKEFRAFFVYSYRVTYQINIDLKEIRVLRVRHTSREPLGY